MQGTFRMAWRAVLVVVMLGVVLGLAGTLGGKEGYEQLAAGPSPEQMLLQDMWNRPYVTAMVPAQHTQMLWNAMEDPNEDMHSSMHSDSGSDRDSDDSGNMDSGSESYEKYDTDSYRSGSSDDGMDSDLKSIIPSSERAGTGLSSHHDNEWDTSKLSNDDDWDKHSSTSDGDDSSDGGNDSAWLKQHSWESGKTAKLKQEIKKMYHKGINAISKSIAKEADEENNNSFYSKWAGGKSSVKGGKSSHKVKTPLSASDMSLYKDAEKSVKKEEEKKAPLIKAVKAADKSEHKAAKSSDSDSKHDEEVKAKLEAADRLSKNLASKAKAHKKTSVKELLRQSAKIAAESKHAKGAQAKKAVEEKAKQLQEEIKEDFSHATAIADNIQSTANKLVGTKLKSPQMQLSD